jgi:hypothetical protein
MSAPIGTNHYEADRWSDDIPALVLAGAITGFFAAVFGNAVYRHFSVGNLVGLLVTASLCATCVIPIVAHLLAAIREALKIPVAALRREPLFEVRRLPEDLREALQPTLRPTIRYLTVREARRRIEAYEALRAAGYRIIAQRGDLAKTVAMDAAVDTPTDLSTHTKPPPDMHAAWQHTQIAVLRPQPATADGQHDSRGETP